MSGDSIGMMEGAFFVGRGELIQWVNELLEVNITKVEQCATGAIYVQILDAIYPGTFPLSKVNWQAKHEYEFVNNFKILQKAFDSNGITRHIEVQKLVKAKYQDNLEFLQWLKRYFDLNYNGEPYDAAGRRKGHDLFLIGSGNKPVAAAPSKVGDVKKPAAKSKIESSAPKKFVKPTAAAGSTTAAPTAGGAGSAAQKQKIQELEEQISELKLTSDTLEKERDFYFGKLRDIEILLQSHQDQENPNPEDKTAALANLVLKILYATEDEKVEVDENGNVNIVSTGAEAQEETVEMKDEEGAIEGEGEYAEGDDM